MKSGRRFYQGFEGSPQNNAWAFRQLGVSNFVKFLCPVCFLVLVLELVVINVAKGLPSGIDFSGVAAVQKQVKFFNSQPDLWFDSQKINAELSFWNVADFGQCKNSKFILCNAASLPAVLPNATHDGKQTANDHKNSSPGRVLTHKKFWLVAVPIWTLCYFAAQYIERRLWKKKIERWEKQANTAKRDTKKTTP
jgi:hypothetical protein